ncbi:MAG: dihydroneopterin aldolase [Coriobacteriaceae bacterium]|nr:dihydroneopterin aldolase [Coriobacteriaceae bacterium]
MPDRELSATSTSVASGTLAKRERGLPVLRGDTASAADDRPAHADRILITGLEVFANHGVYPAENELGQKFVVSLTLFADLRRAGEADDLEASIDYGAVCHEVDAFLRERTFKLIEAAAEGVASLLLGAHPQLLAVRVRLEKPWAPVGLPLASCAVEIERARG